MSKSVSKESTRQLTGIIVSDTGSTASKERVWRPRRILPEPIIVKYSGMMSIDAMNNGARDPLNRLMSKSQLWRVDGSETNCVF